MKLSTKIVEIASLEIGTREAEQNNTGPRIVEYQRATWLEPAPWPWCAAFCCWVLREALGDLNISRIKRCKDASAFGWEKHALKYEWILLPEHADCEPGDFAVYDFSHIGIVVADKGKNIIAVEGNTNGKGERDSESGDGVWLKTRKRSLVKSFVRIP